MADIDDLRLAFERWVDAFHRLDADVIIADVYEAITFFNPWSPFAVQGKAAFTAEIQTLVETMEYSTAAIINPHYQVVGSTGLASGHGGITVKLKDAPQTTVFARFTATLVKADGKWLVASDHVSVLPSGR